MSTPCVYTGVDVLTQDERDLLCAASTADKAGVALGPAGLKAARQLAAYQLGSLKGGVFKINPAGGAAVADLLRAEAQALRVVDVAPRAEEGTVEALATLREGRSAFEALLVEAHKRGIALKLYPDGCLITVWVAAAGDPMARTDGADLRACQWSTATGPDLEIVCEAALDIVRRVPYVAPAAVPTEGSRGVGLYLASVAAVNRRRLDALGCQFGSDTIGRCGARVVPGTTRCAAHPETWVIR